MIIEILLFTLYFVIFFIATVIIHEFGHYFVLSTYYPERKIKIKYFWNGIQDFGLKVGDKTDYMFLTNKEYFNVNLVGVVFGLGFIIFCTLVIDVRLILLLLPYIPGVIPDIKEMFKAIKEAQK